MRSSRGRARPRRAPPGLRALAAIGAIPVALGLVAASVPGAAMSVQATTFSKIADLSSATHLATGWTLDGSGSWAIRDGVLVLEKPGVPAGPIRRPGALAIFQSPPLADATLEVDLRSHAPVTTKQRDLLLVAGWQSPTRFYYVHLSAVRDDVHNGIFLVDDADRRRIDSLSDTPPLTDQAWHRARLVHRASGELEVFVDGASQPIMRATDRTIPHGRLGVGSFDDGGEFRNVRISGTIR
jgi:hypothetical protein